MGPALLAALTCSLPALPPATLCATAVQHVGVDNSCLLHVLAPVTLCVYLEQFVVQGSMPAQCELEQVMQVIAFAISVDFHGHFFPAFQTAHPLFPVEKELFYHLGDRASKVVR